ncbi:MAG: hypothetical protein KA020_14750, partial [Planctomycetes bacterium]|nr:hypothetical protein [Planctomycetota bacterium]
MTDTTRPSLAAVAGLPMAAVPTVYQPMPDQRPRDEQAWGQFLDDQEGNRFYRTRMVNTDPIECKPKPQPSSP